MLEPPVTGSDAAPDAACTDEKHRSKSVGEKFLTNEEKYDRERCAWEVFAQLRAIALADVTRVVDIRDGSLSVSGDLDDCQRAAIASVEKATGGIRVKFYDKLKALELLGKCVGLFDRPPLEESRDSDLLRAIEQTTREVIRTDELQELQQASAIGDDLVE